MPQALWHSDDSHLASRPQNPHEFSPSNCHRLPRRPPIPLPRRTVRPRPPPIQCVPPAGRRSAGPPCRHWPARRRLTGRVASLLSPSPRRGFARGSPRRDALHGECWIGQQTAWHGGSRFARSAPDGPGRALGKYDRKNSPARVKSPYRRAAAPAGAGARPTPANVRSLLPRGLPPPGGGGLWYGACTDEQQA